ncbi:diguanylate cyclase [Pseudomaricurvus alkylphenolicus]|uniref:sensor domain-containing diguanylate cyclase n=1 Tax=Pseudomaricurvus alkylphenolicus TaxID=1306991 RepID=UPI00141F17BF|nr:GGDEF domain-containing protein [Pseudomaricurvus alkylphenolicus]NIB44338.1 diguanylate cyclase [Pseudomaricurvus alkylphenolicus]
MTLPQALLHLPSLDGPLQQSLSDKLRAAGVSLKWQQVSLEQAFDQSTDVLLLTESDVDHRLASLCHRHPVLLLLQDWSLERCPQYLQQGVEACLPITDTDQLANYLLAKAHRHQQLPHDDLSDLQLLQTVIDAVPVPIFYKDEHSIYRGCNRAWGELVGPPREQLLGKSVYDIQPKALADVYFQADKSLLESGGTQRYETQVKFTDGKLHDIEFHKAVFYHPDGRVGGQVGAMLDITERKQLAKQLAESANTDALTGAYNLRSFNRLVHKEISRHQRSGQALSLLILDVDHFKVVNDNHGHPAGNQVLVSLVKTIKAELRDQDWLFRVGGEEFYVLLPDTDMTKSLNLAERLRQQVKTNPVDIGESCLHITASIGAAQLQSNEPTDDWVHRADLALYKAKSQGRDRVMAAD